jgi:hypothetical protein
MRQWIRLVEEAVENPINSAVLLALVNQYRSEIEAYADWSEDKSCFTGMCSTYAKELAGILRDNGFADAIAVSGYYNDVDDEYLDFVNTNDDELSNWDNKWKHWWVRLGDIIIDVTADQFHPSERDAYRVVITNTNDSKYS